jgi:hypothetical protein
MSEADNLRRWPADRAGVYEVWYVTWNDPRTGDGYWLRYITEAPEHRQPAGPRGELWFARFDRERPERTFGIHQVLPPATSSDAPFALHIGDAELGHTHARGGVEGHGHRVRWDLRWDAAPATLRLLPDVMYLRGGLGETTVLSPNPRVALSGTLEIDGETFAFDRAIAGQTHLWGKKHAFSWAWAHCAQFADGSDALLELLAVRLRRGALTLPTLAIAVLELDGERHQLNQFRHTLWNRADWHAGRIQLRAQNAALRVEAELACAPERLIVAPYVDPDGTDVYCANTEIGAATLTISRRRGTRWLADRTLATPDRAHFETGGRSRPSEVRREHLKC